MAAPTAIEILDSLFDLFKQMGGGIALDLNYLEIFKRLQQVRAAASWSADLDFVAVKLTALVGHYAATYQPHHGSERIRTANANKLDHVVEQYSILRAHLEQQLPAA